MYRTCIFCSADLGVNESFELFPVGRRVAIDASRGRLWAICVKCGRWNLAPIEERWEAVEDAERQFRDARLRVQTENIGMAKMRDGTQLVRIGEALQGELAAWRYGIKFLQRRRKTMLMIGGAVVGGGAALLVGLPLLQAGAFGSLLSPAYHLTTYFGGRHLKRRVIYRLDDGDPEGPVIFRHQHLEKSALMLHAGNVVVSLPDPEPDRAWYELAKHKSKSHDRIILSGPEGRTLAARAMVKYNSEGGSKENVASAVEVLQASKSAETYIAQIAAAGVPLAPGQKLRGSINERGVAWRNELETRIWDSRQEKLTAPHALALEMALHEESERRAMEGELAELEDAWREAEEIARIADALPGEPPE